MVSTPEEIRERLSKYDIRCRDVKFPKPEGFVSASVLIPLFIKDGQIRILLTLRSKHLRSHAGLVAFPGGHEDETDQSVVETALREAEEEIGLPAKDVDVLTVLPPSFVRPNKLVTLVVGMIPGNFVPTLNEAEVAKVFSLPLQRFLRDDVVKKEFLLNDMKYWLFYFYDTIDGEKIETWGFTAYYSILIGLALNTSNLTIEAKEGVFLDKDSAFENRRQYEEVLRWKKAFSKM